MVTKPDILLADEPTGALDSASGHQVMELFRQLNEEGMTVIMITHDPEIAAHAKRVLLIRDGILSRQRGGRMKKKKLIIGSVSGVLAVAACIRRNFLCHEARVQTPVKVAPVSAMNNGYWNDNSDISPYGNVTTNLNQNIAYDSSLTVTQIYVKEGDTVKVGDPLIAYDTTLVSMELEMKQMEIDGLGLSIQNVQAELDQLRKTKPVASAAPSALAGTSSDRFRSRK